jgi:hypothetical protein
MHWLTGVGAGQLAVAGSVLVATFLVCLGIGTYTEAPAPTLAIGLLPVMRHTPAWATPAAIAVGLGGALFAFLIIYRPRERR